MVAKVEWHQGELFPGVGFIVTNMSAKPEGVVHFYNVRCGWGCLCWPITWVISFAGWFCRGKSNTGLFAVLLVKLIKIGAKVVRHNRYTTFQMAAVAIDQTLFAEILARIKRLRYCSV